MDTYRLLKDSETLFFIKEGVQIGRIIFIRKGDDFLLDAIDYIRNRGGGDLEVVYELDGDYKIITYKIEIFNWHFLFWKFNEYCSSFHSMGAPWFDKDKIAFEDTILSRFKKIELAFDYIDKVTDRQVSKANGLLAYNSILIAALGTTGLLDKGSKVIGMALVCMVASIVSCVLSLFIMYVLWGKYYQYKDAGVDFKRACSSCYFRSILLTVSIILSLAGTFSFALATLSKYSFF